MSRTLAGLAIAGLLATAAQARPADPAPVVAAERAFAARAAVVGVAPSFLEFMTDDAVTFAPDTVNAKVLYGRRPPGKAPKDGGALLAWWPVAAGIARSGDLGFTTGPSTVNGQPGAIYFTVWVRQASGEWKWVYDGGVDGDGSAMPGAGSAPQALSPGDAGPMDPAKAFSQVGALEAAIAVRARADSAAALKAMLSPDARVQGSKLAPATTPQAADSELATRPKSILFAPLGGRASKAGDLVWTYGDAGWETGRGHYCRIWQRRAGKWALVFDQIIANPPPPKS